MSMTDSRTFTVAAVLVAAVLFPLCEGTGGAGEGGGTGKKNPTAPICRPVITGTFVHRDAPFTQGLCFENNLLFESHGLYGESGVRTLDMNGMVLTRQRMGEKYFGEGCALAGGRLFQITWREQRCFVYSLPGLTPVDTLRYDGEGWGLCSAEDGFVMSDGSDKLVFRDRSFARVATLPVTCNSKPLTSLNELEYARGRIYANVWYSDYIFEIDPRSGCVTRMIDCGEIVKQEQPRSPDFVLNGIAYSPETGRFYITGKKWNTIYIVDIPAAR